VYIDILPLEYWFLPEVSSANKTLSRTCAEGTALMRRILNLPTSINNNNNSLGTDSNSSTPGAFNISKAPAELSTQNVHFVDGDTPWSFDISSSSDGTTKLAGFSDAELGTFLSRPIKTQEYQWTPGGLRLFETFNPWTDFFSNGDVKDKINKYRNLRCNLRMKILLNGNSFYYGRALVSYNPYLVNDNVTLNRAFFEQDLVGASQKPHFLLDPTTSQGGEMCLPFIWPENYLDITQSGWEDNMGRVTIHDFDILRHANGGTDPITVSVFVWAENVQLSIPTNSAVQSGISQRPLDELGFPTFDEQAASKKKSKPTKKVDNTMSNDEFVKDGLISKPASAIAKAANAMSMIPVIAPYAKATELVATRIGQIAKLFGYSRPQVLEDTRNYVPRYFGNICNTDTPEPLVKLTLDSKNELSIDTRIMGLGGEDELAISAIAQRPSYWFQFPWPESAVTDSLLASMTVQPVCTRTLGDAHVTEYHPTALAFAAAPFAAWQGSIKFRFNVIASEYHRGRLRLVYNPRTNDSGAIPFNTVYSTIIDIAEDRDFEYEVKWADVKAWKCQEINTIYPPNYDTLNPAVSTDTDNGTLSVYVVNELATPGTTTAAVKIQVWVSGGDDIAFAIPSPTKLSTLSYFQDQSEIAPYVEQSGEEVMASSEDMSNEPLNATQLATFGDSLNLGLDNQYLVYQGERVASFRDMLRRYNYHWTIFPAAVGSGPRIMSLSMTDFPFYRGWDPDAPDQAINSNSGNSPYQFSNTTLLNYLTPAYVCRRGGLRHKAFLYSSKQPGTTRAFSVTRNNLNATNSQINNAVSSTNVGTNRRAILSTGIANLGGTHLTPSSLNPCLEYETPYYTYGQRFSPARKLDYYSIGESGHQINLDLTGNEEMSTERIYKYISIAEDFQLGLFVGAPVYYSYLNPIAS